MRASLQAEYGRLPAPHNEEDATRFVSIAEKLNETAADKAEIDEAVLKALSFTASGELSPMAAFFGGVVGQEVCAHVEQFKLLRSGSQLRCSMHGPSCSLIMSNQLYGLCWCFLQVMKAVSGKFHPIFQWFYFDSMESLPENLPLSINEVDLQVDILPHCVVDII